MALDKAQRAELKRRQLRRTAYHEAAHAVASVVLPEYLYAVGLGAVVIGRGRSGVDGSPTAGHVDPGRSLDLALAGKSDRQQTRITVEYATVHWCGTAAEMLLDAARGDDYGDDLEGYIADAELGDGAEITDRLQAEGALRGFRCYRAMRCRTMARAVELVRTHWAAIGRVAAVLVKKRRLGGYEEVLALVEG
jgi:hypothetical protein